MHKHLFILAFIYLSPFSSFSQDDLDEIFDNGDRDSRFHLGTEILPWCTGVPNINASVQFYDDITLRAGIGIIPFGFYYDLNNWRPGENLPILDRDVSIGFYYDAQLKVRLAETKTLQDIDAFMYCGYQHWQYGYQDDFTVNRFKANLGIGNMIGLKGRFNMEIRYGFMIGRDRFTYTNSEPFQEFETRFERNYSFGYYKKTEQTKLLMFLDLGIGLNFAL